MSVYSTSALSNVGRKKYRMPIIDIKITRKLNRKGILKRVINGVQMQKCLDCKDASGIKILFRKGWQDASKAYIHNSECISKGKF